LWLVQAQGHYADPQSAFSAYLDQTYVRLDRRTFRTDLIVSLYSLGP
jgi:hypothetical protein